MSIIKSFIMYTLVTDCTIVQYASIIGSLIYATYCTRSNIAYAVGVLARFTSKPNFENCTWVRLLPLFKQQFSMFKQH